jgi:DNA-binding XRE family transcriptional regulator
MTPDDLKRWRKTMGWTQARAARALNRTPLRTYQSWEAGEYPIHALLPLATMALSHGLLYAGKS